jgi:hypothetical protein
MKFEAGKTYFARSICDHNCVWNFEVVKRTAKSVTLKATDGEVKRRGIKIDSTGSEYCLPLGSFSMAPSLNAEREVSA